jgi:hypothetical protein
MDGFLSVDSELDLAIKELSKGSKGIVPFHWELEFPEVFTTDDKGRAIGGFDVIIGNPPFAGKNTITSSTREGYIDWLQTIHEQSHGAADLVAHFFRRSFTLLRQNGCFGLIATNTIGQGDTRSTGLRWICAHDGTIFRARKRLRWPGEAAVVVSVVHVAKGAIPSPHLLNHHEVPTITAYLFHAGGSEDPHKLRSNLGLAFQGCGIGSLGFLLTPKDLEFAAFSQLKHPKHPSVLLLKPYIGGEDLYRGTIERYVLDVDELDAETLTAMPEVLGLLQDRVRGDLLARHEISETTTEWWHFRRPSLGLRRAMAMLGEPLACARVGNALALSFLPKDSISNEKVIVFHLNSFSAFATLQGRVHEIWARFFSATLKDDLQYTPSDCFDSFPFCEGFQSNDIMDTVGKNYYEFRLQLMRRESCGLTTIYNWFHDPGCECDGIPELRDLHDSMDRAVLNAYGWTDIQSKCEFIPEFDEEDDDDNERPTRKKYRYRWPDEIRDDVLTRLLELNRRRMLEEGPISPGEITPPTTTQGESRKTTNAKRKTNKHESDLATGLFTGSRGEG